MSAPSDDLSLDGLLELSIWRDGELLDSQHAVLSVWDHAVLYGDGVFEGIRLRDGSLYRVDLHLARLRQSSHLLGLALQYSDEEILAAVATVAVANRLRDAHVRIIHTRGIGLPGIDPRRCPQTTLMVLLYPFPPLLGTDPLSLISSTIRRKAPASVPAAAKSLNYLDSILAKQQANAAGAGDALMLDATSCIAEATGANLFLVAGDRLRTPPLAAALPGVTRRTIIELAAEEGLPVAVEPVTLGDLYAADEAFLTGTAAGVVPVGAVDGYMIGAAPGTVTERLASAYRRTWSNDAYITRVL